MKRFLATILVAIMCVSIVACSSATPKKEITEIEYGAKEPAWRSVVKGAELNVHYMSYSWDEIEESLGKATFDSYDGKYVYAIAGKVDFVPVGEGELIKLSWEDGGLYWWSEGSREKQEEVLKKAKERLESMKIK